MIEQYQTITQKEFTKRLGESRFKENIDMNDSLLKEKARVLNRFIKAYKQLKKEYMTTANNKGLMKFFAKNKDNIRGLMATLHDRCFWNKDADTSQMISLNPAVNNYWMNLSIFYYIQTFEMILNSGKFARVMYYNYLNEYIDEETKTKDKNRENFLV